MTRRSVAALSLLAAGLIVTSGCTQLPQNRVDNPVPTGALQLVAFDDCGQALQSLRAAARSAVGPWGFGGSAYAEGSVANRGGVAAPGVATDSRAESKTQPGLDYSGTNTHEAGVDEPDLVKTDGRRIVTIANGVLRVVDAASRTQTGRLTLASSGTRPVPYSAANLLLAGDRALVLSNTWYAGPDQPVPAPGGGPVAVEGDAAVPPAPGGPELLLVDLSGKPRVVSRYTMDGSLVDARQVGKTVRVVVRSSPRLKFPYGEGRSAAQRVADNMTIIDQTPVESWLPRYSVEENGRTVSGAVGCRAVSRPAQYSATAMLTVLTFDLDRGSLGAGEPLSIVADGDTVYSNGPTLYVANDQRWRAFPMEGRPGAVPATVEPRTDLYKFDASGTGRPTYAAAGSVSGWLLNQYSMSEWNGRLRVATTTSVPAGGGATRAVSTQSTVYVLQQQGRVLTETGKVGGLGKGERIYAVRFIGSTGYVVTFRQTDPLYIVDLADPAHPTVTGELKITGYSAYLHPAGTGRLVGVGQDASQQGRVQGTQVSLFDISDPAKPARLAHYTIGSSYSEAEYDPHAFLYWPQTGLTVLPIATHQVNGNGSGALALRISDNAITEAGVVAHPEASGTGQSSIRRSLVIDRTLWTVSDTGLLANDLGTLSQQAWLPFAS